jgi:hypothetical protein
MFTVLRESLNSNGHRIEIYREVVECLLLTRGQRHDFGKLGVLEVVIESA